MLGKVGKKIYVGAMILGVGAFIAKLLGAAYRIPLTKIVGATGLGLYQLVFPVYALLLDFSGAGVPGALSKIISSYKGLDKDAYAKSTLFTSLLFFSSLGLLFSVLTAFFSKSIATVQGDENAYLAYVFLAPSVFLVCIISCLRGYFQGYMDMVPTAVSQIVEQVVKLSAGLILANYFMPDITRAVAGATFAITISEAVAAAQLFVFYKLRTRGNGNKKRFIAYFKEFPINFKEIIVYAIPITVAGLILPLSKVVDSFLIVNTLNTYSENATGLYGLYSGVAVTVIGLPVAVCYGIATVAIPAVSGADGEAKRSNSYKTLWLTLAVSLPCALVCFFFSPLIVEILFGYLPQTQKEICVKLLKISSPNVLLLSVLQTANAVLIGKSSPFKPILGVVSGVAVKTVAEIFLLKNQSVNIYGAAIASIACYFVADLINLSMIFVKKGSTADEGKRIKNRRYVNT